VEIREKKKDARPFSLGADRQAKTENLKLKPMPNPESQKLTCGVGVNHLSQKVRPTRLKKCKLQKLIAKFVWSGKCGN